MLGGFDDLDGRVLPDDRGIVCRQWHLWQADGAIVEGVVGTGDAEHGLHDERVVVRYIAVTEIDVDERRRVTVEPAGLDTDGAASHGPFCPVGGDGNAAA